MLRKTVLFLAILFNLQIHAARSTIQALVHSESFYNHPSESFYIECHVTNPQSDKQTITVTVQMAINAVRFEVASDVEEKIVVANQVLNQYESYSWRYEGINPSADRLPKLITISVAEDSGFLLGGCLFIFRDQPLVSSGIGASQNSGTFLFNGGQPF